MITGFATAKGTAAYRARRAPPGAEEHFRSWAGLLISSVGLGTYLGGEDVATDRSYRDTVARYESEPATGEGKKELMAKAKEWEHKRDHAAAQLPNFEYAEAAFQIAIVLGSVAIVAASPALLGISGLLSIAGVLLTLNGYLLLVPLGHGVTH